MPPPGLKEGGNSNLLRKISTHIELFLQKAPELIAKKPVL